MKFSKFHLQVEGLNGLFHLNHRQNSISLSQHHENFWMVLQQH